MPQLLRKGWRVLATLRNSGRGQELFREELKSYGDRLCILELDVTRSEDRRAVVQWIERENRGELDCLVNNAGWGAYGAFEDLSERQLRAQMEICFFGAALLTQELLPLLRSSGGRLVNVSSVLGFVGLPLTSAYCASKFALEGWSESLRFELAPHGVRVILIEPGSFKSQFRENVAWGERTGDYASPYGDQTKRYQQFRDRRAPELPDPQTVIQALLRAILDSEPPFRLRCGSEPRSFYWARKLLPVRLEEFLLKRVYRKIFGQA